MNGDKKAETRQARLRSLIDRAVQPGMDNYKGTASWVYAYGLVRELLAYSAQNQYEVWQHLEHLAEQNSKDNPRDEPRTKVKK